MIAGTLDNTIPGSGYLYRQGKSVASNLKRVERLSNELEQTGTKSMSRRKLFKTTLEKLAKEGSKKPSEALNVGKGTLKRGADILDNVSGQSGRRRTRRISQDKLNILEQQSDSGASMNLYVRSRKENIASNKGLVGRGVNRLRDWLKYKSGNL